MEENLKSNDFDQQPPPAPVNPLETETKAQGVRVKAAVLDWDESLPSWVDDPWPNMIMYVSPPPLGPIGPHLTSSAADVTYNTASFPALVQTLTALLKPSHQAHRPPLLLAYKQRDEAERDLWDMLRERGIVLDKVDEIQGAEEEGQVEIWFGQAQ